MAERMNLLQKIADIRVRLGEAEMKKTGWNPHAKFNYFKLDDFMPTARKICKEAGVLPVESFESDKAVMIVYDCDDLESSIRFECPCEKPNIPGANASQAIGGMITYMRRYLWMILFEITEDDEFDATQGAPDEPPAPPAKARTTQPSAAPKKDERPATGFNPKEVWKQVLVFYGYDFKKPQTDKDNADAMAAAHALFDPYAKNIMDLTEDKGRAILERIENMKKAVGPEDFEDDSAAFMEKGA